MISIFSCDFDNDYELILYSFEAYVNETPQNLYNVSVRKRAFEHVRSAKNQSSLRTRIVWSESSLWILDGQECEMFNEDNDVSNQTAHPRSLIKDVIVLIKHLCHKVRFFTLRFI